MRLLRAGRKRGCGDWRFDVNVIARFFRSRSPAVVATAQGRQAGEGLVELILDLFESQVDIDLCAPVKFQFARIFGSLWSSLWSGRWLLFGGDVKGDSSSSAGRLGEHSSGFIFRNRQGSVIVVSVVYCVVRVQDYNLSRANGDLMEG